MVEIAEKRKQYAVAGRRLHLINALYRMGLEKTRDGRAFEECSLFTLEHVHVSEKCRAAKAFGER